ncbi:MAG: hypothetical protein GY870_08725 [archaeon]|nr:hypothetical protein [archaeon]
MKIELEKEEKEFLLIHLLFAVICVPVLLIPIIAMGIKLFILVTIYNLMIPIFSYLRGYKEWIHLWLFVFILSILFIWPDWFLADQLNTIAFPADDGIFHIGAVSAYMAGLWAIPFFVIVYVGQRVQERKNLNFAYLSVLLMSLLIFGMAEETLWMLDSWQAQNVNIMVDHVAVYIIVPELILGLSTFYYYRVIQEKPHWMKIPAALLITLLYVGTAASSYFLIEGILFPI